EEWLRSLALSNGSEAKIRNIMHAVFNHAVRWEWHERNPITQVRQSSKRMHIPVVLTLDQVEELLLYLEEPTRTAVLVDVMTGLRVGELLALKWSDIDFEKFQVHVSRSISLQHVGECKTEASRKPVPLDSRLADALWNWRTICAYPRPEDWVFASPHTNGVQPYWPGTLNRWHLQPAVKAAGIQGRIGWHTFRHTLCNASQGQWRGCEDSARTSATCKQLGNDESLRTSCHAGEAPGAEPSREHVARRQLNHTEHRSYWNKTDVRENHSIA
ncbi:MAG TPA: tyrosine-type recombinase/integrase, partial [Acidobacteriaceae bacterium]|nr:tyrosine-type recombinase/integrase [Acidobacteriaceae bacterium]